MQRSGCLPFKHIRNSCLTSMWMVREAGTFADAEVVEHEERGEVAKSPGPDGSADDCTNTLFGFDSENALYDGSGNAGHVLRL